jgi:hypothetical protein
MLAGIFSFVSLVFTNLRRRGADLVRHHPAYQGFPRNWFFLLATLTLVFIAWDFGTYVGASDLFWHEDVWIQFLAGFGVGLLFGQLCFVRFLLDARQRWLKGMATPNVPWIEGFMHWLVPDPPARAPADACWYTIITRVPHEGLARKLYAAPDHEWGVKLRWYLFLTWIPLLLCLLIGFARHPFQRWPLAIGVGVAILVGCGFVHLCKWLQVHDRIGWLSDRVQLTRIPPDHPWLNHLKFGAFVVVFAAGALAFFFPWSDGERGSLACGWVCFASCVFLGLLAAFHGLLRLPGLSPPMRWLQTLATATFTGFFLLYGGLCLLSWVGGERFLAWISPILSVCLLFGLLMAGGGFVVISFHRAYLFAFGALIVLCVVASNYPHFKLRFQGLDDYYDRPVQLVDEDLQPEANLRLTFLPEQEAEERQWLEQQYPKLLTTLCEDERNEWRTQPESQPAADLPALRNQHLALLQWRRLRRQCVKLFARLTSEQRAVWKTWPESQAEADLAGLEKRRNALLEFLEVLEVCRLHTWKQRLIDKEADPAMVIPLAVSGLMQPPDGQPWGMPGWMAAVEPTILKPKLVVVAASGGGIRAALWTAVVLAELERPEKGVRNFPDHVRVITGASGGMVGAAYYVATLEEKGGHSDRTRCQLLDDVGADQLTPIVHRLALHDVPMMLVPHTYYRDRGQGLEEAWAQNTNRAMEKTFEELAAGERAGWRPSLIVTPMLVEDGRQLLISNLFLQPLTETAGNYVQGYGRNAGTQRPTGTKFPPPDPAWPAGNPGGCGMYTRSNLPQAEREIGAGIRYSLNALEFFQLFPNARGGSGPSPNPRDRFTLSTAARMSASFPFVASAVDLPTAPRRRVVDAGYYDNYGVALAASWIYRYREWLVENTSGVVLIQVRDSISERRRLYSENTSDQAKWQLSRSIEWLTGPAAGVDSAWQSAMSFHNDVQVQTLSNFFNLFNNASKDDFFTTVVFECPKEIALNWYIAEKEKDSIRQGFREAAGSANREALEHLQQWWEEP